jgi:CelD/BcsL family acetyltransferase involved in cellulose biosynthesis
VIDRSAIDVEISSLDPSALSTVREQWLQLEGASEPSPYLTYDWLESWVAVYEPSPLRLVRIATADRGVIAIGLLEELSGRRLRFAGGQVTPLRGLLSSPEDQSRAWTMLGGWLAAHRRAWTYLEADGAPAAAAVLPRAVTNVSRWFAFELSSSFATYLESRPSSTRRSLVRKLRDAERAGAVAAAVQPAGVPEAIDTFVELHASRARAKREVHAHIDDRLALMLQRIASRGRPELRVVALEQEQRTLAVTVRFDNRGRSCFFNAGFEPSASRLSPGIVVELASIRDAIERGNHWYDLGPGDYRYKRDLGGLARDLIRVRATSGSIAGRIALAAIRTHERGTLPHSRAIFDRARKALLRDRA